MPFISTSELTATLIQEQTMLTDIQQMVVFHGIDFPVKSNVISHLMALKVEGEDKFFASMQRREIFQNKIKMQRERLKTLHQAYTNFKDLYKNYQSSKGE